MVFADSIPHRNILTSSLAICDQARRTVFYPKTDVAQLGPLCAQLRQTREQDLQRYQPIVNQVCQRRWSDSFQRCVPLSGTGTFRLLYRIDRAGQPPLIMRLNRIKEHDIAWEFLIESWIYAVLADRNIPAPLIIDVDVSRRTCVTDYQILTCIEGTTLKSYEDPDTQYMRPELLHAVGAYVARVHCIEIEKYGPLSVQSVISDDPRPYGVHDSWRDYILLLLQQHAQVCLHIGAITRNELLTIEKIFAQHTHVFDDVPSVLLHGDVGNQNFISYDGLTIAGLVDWEDCMSGDPVFDIAFWGTFFRDHMLNDFLDGYRTVRALPADFTLRYWLYYLRIALSKTVHRFYFGYTDAPGRPPASLRIQKALEHLRSF